MIDNAWPQAAFDPRILNLPLIGQSTSQAPGTAFPLTDTLLQRGYIKQDKSSYSGSNAPIYACAFLYNPSTIAVMHAIDASATTLTVPQYQRNPNDTGTYLVGLAATVSFSLLFDRTYEINSGIPIYVGDPPPYPDNIPQPNGSAVAEDPRSLGVLADVQALYRVCGVQNQQLAQSWTDGAGNTNTSNLAGMMLQVPAWCHFGGELNTGSLSYFGYISALSIQYTHFSTQMTPMRCAVAVNFTLLPRSV